MSKMKKVVYPKRSTMSDLKVYTMVCSRCERVIHIEQRGEDIEEFLEEILEETHVKNTYDSFVSYLPKKEKTKKVNVEIDNKICCPEGWDFLDSP
jgi:Fe2+ or Zn2+ uptake regulation protein